MRSVETLADFGDYWNGPRGAFQIVLELARENVVDPTEMPDEHAGQIHDLYIDEPDSAGLSLHQIEKRAKTRADKPARENLEQHENGTYVIEMVAATIQD